MSEKRALLWRANIEKKVEIPQYPIHRRNFGLYLDLCRHHRRLSRRQFRTQPRN